MGWATCPPYPQKPSGALAEAGAPEGFFKIERLSLFQQLFYFIHFGLECLVYVQPVFYYAARMQYRGVCAFSNQRTDAGQ